MRYLTRDLGRVTEMGAELHAGSERNTAISLSLQFATSRINSNQLSAANASPLKASATLPPAKIQ
jgi:hypothetical protein